MEVIESYYEARTFDVEVNDFAAYWKRVDGASISTCVVISHLSYLQVPLVDVRPHDAESRVVNNTTIVVCQRHRIDVQPSNLTTSHAHTVV